MSTERLQSAIAKARAQRKGGEARAPVKTPSSPLSQGWSELARVDLDIKRLERMRIMSATSGPEATPFDILRTRVVQRMRENGWRRVAITSPTPRCGKSTIALNLAFGLTRQPDRKIASLEMDMRRPSHEKILGLPAKNRSVARFLTGEESFSASAILGRPNLAIGLNSQAAANASDVLLGDSVGPALARFDAELAPDIILFDTPPLLANDDTMACLNHVDCALIVAAAGETSVKEVDQCERLIAQETDVMGVVLNKSRYGATSVGYDYY